MHQELAAALPRDQWLLASQLQKSVRRGRADHAEAAASVLADMVPEYVAGRLPVIAYEDIGVADPNLLLWVKHTAASLPFLPHDDRRAIAGHIAFRLAKSIKSRTACDIVCLLEASEETLGYARDLARCTVGDWIASAADRQLPLIRRSVALRFALGLGARGIRASALPGDKATVLQVLATAMQLPASVVAAVHAGTQTHNLQSALPLAYDLLHAESPPVIKAQSRLTARATESHGILLCAVDMFTRCGRGAYRRLAQIDGDLRSLLGKLNGQADLASVIGMLLFHAEGSLLDRTLVSARSAELLTTIEALEARQAGLADSADAKAPRLWLRRNLELVDRYRCDALANYLRHTAAVTEQPLRRSLTPAA